MAITLSRLVFEIFTTYIFRPHVKEVSATFDGHKATLTGEFDFQYVASYYCSIVTIAVQCTVVELGHGTERRTHGRIEALLNVPTLVADNSTQDGLN